MPLTDSPEIELVIRAGKNGWRFHIPSERGTIVHMDALSMTHGAGRHGDVRQNTSLEGSRLVAAAYPTKSHGSWLAFCDAALGEQSKQPDDGSAALRIAVASPRRPDGSVRAGAPRWAGGRSIVATPPTSTPGSRGIRGS